ncbi:MAG: RNA methyltransferase [Halothiobacillaceae bacterium]
MIQKKNTTGPSLPGQDSRFARIRIVLVGTTHPGNIGSTARAMKTMGFARLILVAPKASIDTEAQAMASGAVDVLQSAQIVQSLDEALVGCHWVVGASARLRDAPHEVLTVRQAAEQAARELAQAGCEMALVFGREHAGLTNAELGRCHAHMIIPANPVYSSLNLAQAVQVVAYELRHALVGDDDTPPTVERPAPAPHHAVENLLAHWQTTLEGLGFLDPANPRHLMQKLRHLLQRARVTPNEVDILRGMLTVVQRHIHKQD